METFYSGSQFEGTQSIMTREAWRRSRSARRLVTLHPQSISRGMGVRGGWLHCVHSQEAGENLLVLSSLSPLHSLRTRAHGMVLLSFRVGLSTLINPIQKLPHRHSGGGGACLLGDFRSCQVYSINLQDVQELQDPSSPPGHLRDSKGNGCGECGGGHEGGVSSGSRAPGT